MATVLVPPLDGVFSSTNPPASLRFFRNIVSPSASAAVGLSDRLNTLMARRSNVLVGLATNTGLHSSFDSGSTSSIVTYRWVGMTGPVAQQVRLHLTLLPAAVAVGGISFAQVRMTPGLTSTGGAVAQNVIFVAQHGTTTSFDSLFDIEQDFDIGPSQIYRFELFLVNELRIVSASMYENPLPNILGDTTATPALINPSSIAKGKPITSQQVYSMISAADRIYKAGKVLGTWCADYPGDEATRTSSTPANIIDASTAVTSTTPGWLFDVSNSGTLSSTTVPVTFWVYASTSGSGTVRFIDDLGTTISTVTAGATGWYAGSGSMSTSSTKLDVLLAGDGTNLCTLYACGAIQGPPNSDIVAVPELSWSPVRPRYVGSTSEVITRSLS